MYCTKSVSSSEINLWEMRVYWGSRPVHRLMMLRIASRASRSFQRSIALRTFASKPEPKDNEVEPPVVGPGGPSDKILGMYEQSAGLERLEYLAGLAGRSIFLMEPLKVDRFGTLKAPIPVESISGERMVGCSGFPVESHELMWFNVSKEKGPGRCPECGQAFAIQLANQDLHQHHQH